MQAEAGDLCELHKQPLTFICRHQKCLPGYYAFGCADCLAEGGLHRHAHQAKFRKTLDEFLLEVNTFFYEDPHILELIEQTKGALVNYRKENKFYKDNYNRMFDMLRIKAISRLPKEGSEELETLLDIKERRLRKIKQSQIARLEGSKEQLLRKDSNALAERRYLQLRDPLERIVRKFRINYQRSNPDFLNMIRIDRELQEIDHPKAKLEQLKDLCPPVYRSEGNVLHLFKPLERFDDLLRMIRVELEVTFDANLELKLESYKLILGIVLNQAYKVESLRLIVTDAFITKDKVALLQEFLIEMSESGALKEFSLLNKEAISGVSMLQIQQQLTPSLPANFRLRIAYFYS